MKNKILIGCGLPSLIIVILFVSFMVWIIRSPESGVLLSNEMEPYAIEYIADHKILNDTEQLIAYYDATLSCDSTEAAILTSERVIYHNNGNNTYIQYSEIKNISHRQETMIGDIFEIIPKTGATMKIEIAPLNQGETFKNVLMDMWKSTKD